MAPGLYFETVDFGGKAIRVTSRDGAESTVLDGRGALDELVRFTSGEGRGSVLEGFTIRDAHHSGVVCEDSSPTILANVIEGSDSTGGVHCLRSSPRIHDNTIRSNFGGGIVLEGSPALITSNRIVGNASYGAGGLSQRAGSDAIIRDNEILENTAATDEHGYFAGTGGLSCSSSSPRIERNLFARNASLAFVSTRGGALFLESGAPRVIGNRFLENRANRGAGLRCHALGAVIEGNTIRENVAEISGGGIWCSAGTFVNNMIFGNVAGQGVGEAGLGGGAFVSGPALFLNCTLAANASQLSTGTSGVHFADSRAQLVNTIVFGNFPGPDIGLERGSPSIRYCDIEGGWPGEGNIDADPRFQGPGKGNFRLDCASPCAEAGTNEPGWPLPRLDHEGRDLRRIGVVDIGADEIGARWRLTGQARPGAEVRFTATSGPGQWHHLSEVYLSLGEGPEGGLPVPGADGRTIGLDMDLGFRLWLGGPPSLRRLHLRGCSGVSTEPWRIPTRMPVGTTISFAGVSWDVPLSTTGPVSTVTETRSFVIE
ncbi:MAG: right-handed parallel beta-helix repeat-containing protein [Planctomycetota bacterium]